MLGYGAQGLVSAMCVCVVELNGPLLSLMHRLTCRLNTSLVTRYIDWWPVATMPVLFTNSKTNSVAKSI